MGQYMLEVNSVFTDGTWKRWVAQGTGRSTFTFAEAIEESRFAFEWYASTMEPGAFFARVVRDSPYFHTLQRKIVHGFYNGRCVF